MSRQTFLDNYGILGLRDWVWGVIIIISIIVIILSISSIVPSDTHAGFSALDCESMREIMIGPNGHSHHYEIFAENCL